MDTLAYRAGRGLTGDAFLARDGQGVTRKQREALDAVRKLTEELGRPPTFVQVGNRLGLSAHGAAKRLKPLRGRFVRWEPYDFGTLACI
jgi:SOS-response transcriptional repressor LexA